jgi:tRNA G18 (ribose-2'-O)-methylase SpoU
MAFTEKKFLSLSPLNRTKKLAFAIREFLDGREESVYIEELLCWYNACLPEEEKQGVPQSRTQWQILSEKLLQQIGEDYDYIDSRLFDAKEKSHDGKGVILLDNLRAPYNVGGILRSAQAFNAQTAVLCGITPGLDNAKVKRTSMNVQIETLRFDTTQEAISFFKAKGFTVISIEKCNGSIDICDVKDLPDVEKRVLVLGNEEFGVSQEVLEMSDLIVHIPLTGSKNSLNVCTAAGIAMYALLK